MIISLTACNSNNHISRVVFSEVKDFSTIKNKHSSIKSNQVKDDVTTLFNNGGLYYRYAFSTKGTLRYDDLSFHDINASCSAGYYIYWSLDDEFIKVDGEKETNYFVKHTDGTYWQCKKNEVNGQITRVRTQITNITNFRNYARDTINHYCSIYIPLVLSITAGIDGNNVSYSTSNEFREFSADVLFKEENYNSLIEISNKYKQENKGYSLDLTYGSDSDTSLCATLKGKLNANDFHLTDFRQGTVNIDAFASFKDNFISQYEIILDANTINLREKFNTNLDSHLYMSEEVSKDTCQVEKINVEEFDIEE